MQHDLRIEKYSFFTHLVMLTASEVRIELV